MNVIRSPLVRVFLLVALIASCAFLAYGKEFPSVVGIVQNAAWNDFVTQIRFLPDDAPQDSLLQQAVTVQEFLKAHETETRVGAYDLEVFRAIDRLALIHRRPVRIWRFYGMNCPKREEQAKFGK